MEEEKVDELESILISIKKNLGLDSSVTDFDTDITIHINAAFATLNQIGIGPDDGFAISDENDTWEDFLQSDSPLYNLVQEYVYLRVKLGFDTPTSSIIVDTYKQLIAENEWRLRELSDGITTG